MSIPQIPGYTGSNDARSLAAIWPRPHGDFPDELWPIQRLRRINSSPTGWLTVEEEEEHTERSHGGTHSILATPEAAPGVLKEAEWSGHLEIGEASIVNDTLFSDGITHIPDDGLGRLGFFSSVKTHHGLQTPTLFLAHPFLWYWDAFPTETGWSYLDAAGRDAELVRSRIAMDSWKVEVAALELRSFLAASGQVLIVQQDYVARAAGYKFNDANSTHASDWARFRWQSTSKSTFGLAPFARFLGKSVVAGQQTARVPSFIQDDSNRSFPEFIYGVDDQTGELLRHSCNPKLLGTYFDHDSSRLHYLTPVYFKREVLGRYAAEPRRYRVRAHRLECLDLWGVELSTNSAGLVELYLGDLGEKVPFSELAHWVSYNVPPEGAMDEGRFRRDFLGQWVSSPDPVGELRRARTQAAETMSALIGSPVWRALDPQTAREFENLIGPTTDDPSSLAAPVLVLTKALVDSIDPAPLKDYLGGAEANERSLSLLKRLIDRLGDTADSAEPLRALQNFRSAGGVAHLPGSGATAAETRLGISGLAPWPAFLHITERLTETLLHIRALALAAADEENGEEPSPPQS